MRLKNNPFPLVLLSWTRQLCRHLRGPERLKSTVTLFSRGSTPGRQVTVRAVIQGRGCDWRFECIPSSDAPSLMSVHTIQDLGTEIYVAKDQAIFSSLSNHPVGIARLREGHLVVDVTKFSTTIPRCPPIQSKEVDDWATHDNILKKDRGIRKRQWRKQWNAC